MFGIQDQFVDHFRALWPEATFKYSVLQLFIDPNPCRPRNPCHKCEYGCWYLSIVFDKGWKNVLSWHHHYDPDDDEGQVWLRGVTPLEKKKFPPLMTLVYELRHEDIMLLVRYMKAFRDRIDNDKFIECFKLMVPDIMDVTPHFDVTLFNDFLEKIDEIMDARAAESLLAASAALSNWDPSSTIPPEETPSIINAFRQAIIDMPEDDERESY